MIAHMNSVRISIFAYIETSGFDHYYPSPQVKFCVISTLLGICAVKLHLMPIIIMVFCIF